MVTELGEGVDLIKLLQMSWEDRFRVRHCWFKPLDRTLYYVCFVLLFVCLLFFGGFFLVFLFWRGNTLLNVHIPILILEGRVLQLHKQCWKVSVHVTYLYAMFAISVPTLFSFLLHGSRFFAAFSGLLTYSKTPPIA